MSESELAPHVERRNRQGLKRQHGVHNALVLFAGKSDWNELLCGCTKPGVGKPTKAESPAAGIKTEDTVLTDSSFLIVVCFFG